jgi:ABC-2 type transport system ATP-binding protein
MLEIRNLEKFYGKTLVLDGLNLEIERGKIYGLLGANGTGKTTTINCICSLLQWNRGEILLDGQPISRKNQFLIGICPQENLLYHSLTCEDNLWFYGRLYAMEKKVLKDRIKWCLEAVNLMDKSKSFVATLSGGMQRRLNMAISLIHYPQFLILDEPTTGLDIEARYQMWDFIQQLQKDGMTILLTTHLLDEAEKLCQKIGILKDGKIIAEGSLQELKNIISAVEIVTIETTQEKEAIIKGKELGFEHRYYGKNLAFWLPKMLDLKKILELFDNIPIDSITKQPVKLEHIYLEATTIKKI